MAQQRLAQRPTSLWASLLSLLLLTRLAIADSAPTPCQTPQSQDDINSLFAIGGPNTKVQLCPGIQVPITKPIRFTAVGQELSTQGYPTDDTRAELISNVANSSNIVTMFYNNNALRNIQLNGNQVRFGRSKLDDLGMIEAGGQDVTNQVIDHIKAGYTQGWSCLHLYEAGGTCMGVVVSNSQFGPSGQPPNDPFNVTNSPAKAADPMGYNNTIVRPVNQWADGISMACLNSLIVNNTITDATDGAIVLFGAMGTQVRNNTIIASTRNLLSGISMVDVTTQGNFTGVVAQNNTVKAAGAMIKMGFSLGPPVWFPNRTAYAYGASVIGNTILSDPLSYLAYGIAAIGIQNFVVQDNVASANFGGQRDIGCTANLPFPVPTFLLQDPSINVNNQLQPGFVDISPIQTTTCADAGPVDLNLTASKVPDTGFGYPDPTSSVITKSAVTGSNGGNFIRMDLTVLILGTAAAIWTIF